MKYPMFIYGEMHTPEERSRIEELILEQHSNRKFDYLLCEDLGIYTASTRVSKERLMANAGKGQTYYGISERSVEFSALLNIPVMGIDDWSAETQRLTDRGRLKEAFKAREQNMVRFMNRFHLMGRCAVIVGDTHLRTIDTPELGDPSYIQKAFRRDRTVEIIRSPIGEIK